MNDKVNCKWSVLGGWTNGWDSGFEFNKRDGSAILAGIKARPNCNLEMSYMISTGDILSHGVKPLPPQPLPPPPPPRFLTQTPNFMEMDGFYQNFVLDWRINNRLNYGMEATYGNYNYNLSLDSISLLELRQKTWSVANYLNYRWNSRWSTALRFEYVDMNDGIPITLNPTTFLGGAVPFGHVYSVTLGTTWRPFASRHLAIQPEIRYDWFNTSASLVPADLLSGGVGITWSF